MAQALIGTSGWVYPEATITNYPGYTKSQLEKDAAKILELVQQGIDNFPFSLFQQ